MNKELTCPYCEREQYCHEDEAAQAGEGGQDGKEISYDKD